MLISLFCEPIPDGDLVPVPPPGHFEKDCGKHLSGVQPSVCSTFIVQ